MTFAPRSVLLAVGLLVSCSKSGLQPRGDGGGTGNQPGIPDAPSGNPSLDGAILPPPINGDAAPASASGFTCRSKDSLGNAGCSFFPAQPAVGVQGFDGWENRKTCYAAFVVNPGTRPVKLAVARNGANLPVGKFARLPRGTGTNLTYQPYDEVKGLAPGELAILFLSGETNPSPVAPGGETRCPYGTASAVTESAAARVDQNGVGQAFHLTSDSPVVVYDINPYEGAQSFLTSASLLLPAEVWERSAMVAGPAPTLKPGYGRLGSAVFMMVIAAENGTVVSVKAPVRFGLGRRVAQTPANQVLKVELEAGEFVHLVDDESSDETRGLSGTLVSANKPITVLGGASCFMIPGGTAACDAVHQQIPPVSMWGHEYAAVRYRSRMGTYEEPVPWQVVAAVDGTVLTYSPKTPTAYSGFPLPAPTTLNAGQPAEFWTSEPFVIASQDADHPFYMAAYMTGGNFLPSRRSEKEIGVGDPEFVNVIPTAQYMTDYTFLTDPSYSETSLVVVRRPGGDGKFADVKLACAAEPIKDWTALGRLEFARVQLTTGKYQSLIPGCDNGVLKMASTAPFGVTVWGWNGPGTGLEEYGYVSYAYPGGAALKPTNVVTPTVD